MLTWASLVRSRIQAMVQATASPMAMPPAAPATNLRPACTSEKLLPTAAPTASR